MNGELNCIDEECESAHKSKNKVSASKLAYSGKKEPANVGFNMDNDNNLSLRVKHCEPSDMAPSSQGSPSRRTRRNRKDRKQSTVTSGVKENYGVPSEKLSPSRKESPLKDS